FAELRQEAEGVPLRPAARGPRPAPPAARLQSSVRFVGPALGVEIMGIVGREHRAISVDFIRGVFERDHPGVADPRVVEAYAQEVLKYDDSVPTATYVDMVNRLPLLDPARIPVPTLLFHALHAFFSTPVPAYRG
ncbi:MAG: hypothetical protein ACREKF_01165, partial [Candidatus Methylomirabilales bacterium]